MSWCLGGASRPRLKHHAHQLVLAAVISTKNHHLCPVVTSGGPAHSERILSISLSRPGVSHEDRDTKQKHHFCPAASSGWPGPRREDHQHQLVLAWGPGVWASLPRLQHHEHPLVLARGPQEQDTKTTGQYRWLLHLPFDDPDGSGQGQLILMMLSPGSCQAFAGQRLGCAGSLHLDDPRQRCTVCPTVTKF